MRVGFFDPEQDSLTSQRKGELFEHLTKRLAGLAGYEALDLRRKHNSLEYDLEGRSRLQGAPLLGEAKAHARSIDGKELAAFVGKLIPLGIDCRVEGLFISTSAFTPDAVDYLDGVKDKLKAPALQVDLQTLVGDEIPAFFVRHSGYASEGFLRTRVRESLGMDLLDSWLVVGERGDFLVCSCGPNTVTAATAYAVFRPDGSSLSLPDGVLERLEDQLADLRGLEALAEGEQSLFAGRSARLPSPVSGAGWFDYRFPAPPDCFIGRGAPLDELQAALESVRSRETAMRAVQVLSRSGVGKSSLLIKLQASATDVVAITVDGRNLRSPSDTRLAVSQSVEAVNAVTGSELRVPASLDQVDEALQSLGDALAARSLVLAIQIDQFESTLAVPSVFDAVLNAVETTTAQALPIVWIFARKNDVAATYDDGAQIDLRRLNELSRPVSLNDFSPSEGRELLQRLADRLGQSLRDDLAQAISAFSGGFPWLHKRLCAHVISMHEEGFTQRDLVQAGLRAEDLFEEDLAGLDEQDKALLRRIAAHLPATAAELTQHLEAEVSAERLTDRLNDYLGRKLLRRSGDIYDTYNDVFKTYLVTDSVPFESRYIFRASPRAAIKLLDSVQEYGPIDLSAFQNRVGGNPIAVLNKLRDLRLLGLIDPKPGRVALTSEASGSMDDGSLGELLRKRLRANALVVRVLDLVAAETSVDRSAIVSVLKRELPHVEVTTEVWDLYAKTLIAWMHFASMAQSEGTLVKRREFPADELLQGRAFSGATFTTDTFIPTARPPQVVALLGLLGERPRSQDELRAAFGFREVAGVVRDAVALDLASFQADGAVCLGRSGRMLAAAGRDIVVQDVALQALQKPNVKALLDHVSAEPLSEESQRAIMAQFGSANWSDDTWSWRMGVLRSWLYATGQTRNKRGHGLVAV